MGHLQGLTRRLALRAERERARRIALLASVISLLLSTAAPAQTLSFRDTASSEHKVSAGPGSFRPSKDPQDASIDAPGATDRRSERTPIRRAPHDVGVSTAPLPAGVHWTSIGGLLLILAMIVALGRLAQRLARRSPPQGFDGVVEVLGRRALDRDATLHIVRIGQRVLVIGASSAGLRTLTEIDEPLELQHFMAGLTEPAAPPCRSFPGLAAPPAARPRSPGLPGQPHAERATQRTSSVRTEAAHG